MLVELYFLGGPMNIISLICSQAQCNIDMVDMLFVCGGLVLTSHSLSGHQVDLP